MSRRGPKYRPTVNKRARSAGSGQANGIVDEPPDQPVPVAFQRGALAYLINRPQLLSYLNLVVAILLIFLAVWGILNSSVGVFAPLGLGLLGLRFFVVYVAGLGVNLGRVALPLNIALLLGALICVVSGLMFKI